MRVIIISLVMIFTLANCDTKEEPYFSDIDPMTIQEGSIDSLIKQLSHPDRLKRKYACDGISIYMKLDRGPHPIQAFYPIKEQLLKETDAIVKDKLVSFYISFPESLYKEEGRLLLLKIATDPTDSTRNRHTALQGLLYLKDDRAVNYTMSVVKSAQSDTTFLKSLIKRKAERILASATYYLTELRYTPAVPEIAKIMLLFYENRTKINYSTYGTILIYPNYLRDLAKFGDTVVPFLDSLLSSNNDTLRFYAAEQLAFMGKDYVLPVLIEAYKKSFRGLALYAMHDIKKLDPKLVIPILKEAFYDTTKGPTGSYYIAWEANQLLERRFGYQMKYDKTAPTKYKIVYEPPEYKDYK